MKYLKLFESFEESDYYFYSDLETDLKATKKIIDDSTKETISNFLKKKGFIKMKHLKKNSDEYFKNNCYEVNFEKQIYLHLSNHRGTINIMEDMKFIDKSEYYTRTQIHPNSEETRSKVRNVTQQEITKLEEVCGFKLERHHIGANKALISDRYPIKFNIAIDYIAIWAMEDEWFIVDVQHHKYPALFKCDQLEGVKLLIDDIRISYSIPVNFSG